MMPHKNGTMKAKELTAFCGLYCGDCIRYQSKASDLASQLLNEFDKRHFKKYAEVKKHHTPEFENYDAVVHLLKAISAFSCQIPCRMGGDGCGGACKIIRCVKDKSYQGCWECGEFESCQNLNFLKPFHGDAPIQNLRKIREIGIENWASHREKCYLWS
jgi:hypothetical protein